MNFTEIHTERNGKPVVYKQVSSGTCFRKDTPEKVMVVLERLRAAGTECRIFYGNTVTGQSWLDENDMVGRIGRSTGTIKIPLIVPLGDDGGPGLLESSIIRIDTRKKTLYRHPKFFVGDMSAVPGTVPDLPWNLFVNGQLHASLKTNEDAIGLAAFLCGKVFDPPK